MLGRLTIYLLVVVQIYSLLEHHVDQPAFLAKLEAAKQSKGTSAVAKHGDEVLHEEWWEAPAGQAGPSENPNHEEFTQVLKHFVRW